MSAPSPSALSALHRRLRATAPLDAGTRAQVLRAAEVAVDEGRWHPTGFAVFRLHASPQGDVRLHVWPEAGRRWGDPCWTVHDHTWDLTSHVLAGVVGSHDVDVDVDVELAAGRSAQGVLYDVAYGADGRSRMLRRAAVASRSLGLRRTAAGGCYRVDAGRFHASVVPEGAFAATVVATRPGQASRPRVLGAPSGETSIEVVRPAVQPQRARDWLRRLSG